MTDSTAAFQEGNKQKGGQQAKEIDSMVYDGTIYKFRITKSMKGGFL